MRGGNASYHHPDHTNQNQTSANDEDFINEHTFQSPYRSNHLSRMYVDNNDKPAASQTPTIAPITVTTTHNIETQNGILHYVCARRSSLGLINWKELLFGQILALILTASSAANATLHLQCNFSAPATQAGLVYLMISFNLICVCNTNHRSSSKRWTVGANTNGDYGGVSYAKHSNACETQYDCDILHNNNNKSNNSSTTDDNFDDNILQEQCLELRCTHTACSSSIPFTPSLPTPPPPTTTTTATATATTTIQGPIWIYFIMAFFDVEANYCTYLAFRYTTLTSVTLLDALAIPSAMLCSRLLLSRSYRRSHFMGAMLCMIGITLNVVGDSYQQHNNHHTNDVNDYDGSIDEHADADAAVADSDSDIESSSKYSNRVLGDMLAILGGSLYGLNDVLAEKKIKELGGVQEYLGMLGFFGTCICILQAFILEWDQLSLLFGGGGGGATVGGDDDDHHDHGTEETSETCSHSRAWLILTASTLCSTIAYFGMSQFLAVSEAALLNLSLLTSDLWSVVFSVVAEQISPSMFFWVALVLIFFGVFVYELSPSPIVSDRNDCDGSCDGDGGASVGGIDSIDDNVVFQSFTVGRKTYDDIKDDHENTII